jgi:hypothetical protein
VGIASQVLGHGSLATTERHYNLARGQEATESWHETLDRLRRAKKRHQVMVTFGGVPSPGPVQGQCDAAD